MDAKKGFWMIQLSEESSKLTAFSSPFGVYYDQVKTVKLSDASIKKIMEEATKDEQIQNLIEQISDGCIVL
ncbi:hypothetical protein J6590_025868 [Homalodisca vitripennis]|nr:hypothetical protein J6590_025868 [Homalodisca vitripennis]